MLLCTAPRGPCLPAAPSPSTALRPSRPGRSQFHGRHRDARQRHDPERHALGPSYTVQNGTISAGLAGVALTMSGSGAVTSAATTATGYTNVSGGAWRSPADGPGGYSMTAARSTSPASRRSPPPAARSSSRQRRQVGDLQRHRRQRDQSAPNGTIVGQGGTGAMNVSGVFTENTTRKHGHWQRQRRT